ncbi:MAG: hypothetical protein V7632_3894 [Bradyrhizobium sp.]|jgi:hypothetical protein
MGQPGSFESITPVNDPQTIPDRVILAPRAEPVFGGERV